MEEKTLKEKQAEVIKIKRKHPELGILGVKGYGVCFDREKSETICQDIDYFLKGYGSGNFKFDME